MERHIETKILGEQEFDGGMAAYIRQNSRQMARPRKEVEAEIERRSRGIITSEDVEDSEKI